MKRALPAALLLALAVAAPATASGPHVHKTAIGRENPVAAFATVDPPVHLFGEAVTAKVTVIADTKRVDPARIRVSTNFAPYAQAEPPTEARSANGRIVQETWTWTLRCLTAACLPVVPPSDLYHFFSFSPAFVHYVGTDGKAATIHARFPIVEELSEVSHGIVSYLTINKVINWQYQLTPAAAARYSVPPGLVFWAALALAALLGAAGLAVLGRWVLALRAPDETAAPALPPSYLERALALFFWANAHGDETLQRKALERVADELPLDVIDLSDAARELAWSPETPEEDEVEAISERAGVPAHHESGAGE
jgi:hypothetical protein